MDDVSVASNENSIFSRPSSALPICSRAVAACGADFSATVLPHILRGVALIGVDSVMAPREKREGAWARLARDLDKAKLSSITTVEPMSKLPELANDILAGQIRGRVVIDIAR
jgi:NADPH:quinone reductase-like Zn-dependent oxidoreductase